MGARCGGRSLAAARLAQAAPLDDADGHALAGMIDAEGSFAIVRNNQGRNWRCVMRMVLRRDDVRVLLGFQALTGLGTIFGVPGRGNSKPQAAWTVQSVGECLRLAELLEAFPLRGRKRLEADIWREAVRAQALKTRGRADLAAFSQLLPAVRRYVDPGPAVTPDPSADQPGLLWFLGGFFTGEGSFHLTQRSAGTVITLRRDDRPLLVAMARLTGLGRIYDIAPHRTSKPGARWHICSQSELPEAIELLSAARLQGRKKREFRVWCVGAEEFICARRDGRRRNSRTLELAGEGLRRVREYRDVPLPANEDPRSDSRRAYAEVLRTFGASSRGMLTCTAYSEARREHPHWPTYETLNRAFGSWPNALAEAGLERRAHPRSRRVCQRQPPGT
jgi:hypothetical protein